DPYLPGRELDRRVAVDREVAERMRGGERRRQKHARDDPREDDRPPHRSASSSASILAPSVACWIEKFGLISRARARSRRAASRSPSFSRIIPAWSRNNALRVPSARARSANADARRNRPFAYSAQAYASATWMLWPRAQ